MRFMDCLMYHPDSLAAVRQNTGEYTKNPKIDLEKLIDFDNKKVNIQQMRWDFHFKNDVSCTLRFQARNKLTILSTKCPKLLLNTLQEACLWAIFLKINIIQLSYENYDDPKQGRKDVSVGRSPF